MFFLFIFKKIVYIVVLILQFAMLLRALLSWLPMDGDGKVADFLYFVTEPVILPVRKLLEKSEFVQNFPMDIPFFVTFMLISVVSMFLV